jgi:hypothetical protein
MQEVAKEEIFLRIIGWSGISKSFRLYMLEKGYGEANLRKTCA